MRESVETQKGWVGFEILANHTPAHLIFPKKMLSEEKLKNNSKDNKSSDGPPHLRQKELVDEQLERQRIWSFASRCWLAPAEQKSSLLIEAIQHCNASYINVDPLRFVALFTASVILRRLMKMPMKLMKANSTKARKTIRKQNRMYLEFCGYVIMVGFTDTLMNDHKKGAKMMFLDGILRIM